MSSPTPSDGAINAWLAGEQLVCGAVTLEPLTPEARRLLRALVAVQADLDGKKGAEQVAAVRAAYNTASDAVGTPASTATTHATTPPRWRLHRLRGSSIRGLAPYGEEFLFHFDGDSTFIYGPNGTGKSSLMNALGWTLTGGVTTDCEDPSGEVSLTSRPKGDKKATKLRAWPVITTLPARLDPKKIEPACWAELTLRSQDGTRTLHVKRTLDELQTSTDGVTWSTCTTLDDHGISPLDLQLSVTAATMFGRQSIESAPNTRSLLSLMLGYDALEELGSTSASLAAAMTREITKETKHADECQATLTSKLNALTELLRENHPLRLRLAAVTAATGKASALAAATQFAEFALREAEGDLGTVLGVSTEANGLAGALESALATLSRPLEALLPALSGLQTDGVLTGTPDDVAQELAAFERKAAERIRARLDWWRQEVAPGSKARLLLQAAASYDATKGLCPVCDQSIQGRPVQANLVKHKDAPPSLRAEVRVFFRDLADDLDQAVPLAVRRLGDKLPAARLREDWGRLLQALPAPLAPLTGPTDATLASIIAGVGSVEFANLDLIPGDAEPAFRAEATPFVEMLRAARLGVAVLAWAVANLKSVLQAVTVALIAPEAPASLSGTLARGKDAAGDLAILARVRDGLLAARNDAVAVDLAADTLSVLDEMRTAIDEIKGVGKYAEAQVALVFDRVREKTRANFANLYPHSNRSIPLSRLHLNTGRDMTVEPLLDCETFEVPGQHFSNAGCLRAVALAFFFALLEDHPGGLGFVLMDDPILSLDDNHRESWSANVLRPVLQKSQVILATHQRQFLNNCRTDFSPGRIVELNPRASGSGRLTWRPGDRLDRADQLLKEGSTSAVLEMRKYLEDLLITLDAYSPVPFVNRHKPSESLEKYAQLKPPNPLAGSTQEKLCNRLRSSRILQVLNAGAHAATEADVSDQMAGDCLEELRTLDALFRRELERLEDQRLRELRGKMLAQFEPEKPAETPAPVAARPALKLRIGDEAASWPARTRINVIGTAAAQTRGCVIDRAEVPVPGLFQAGLAVLVGGDALAPLVLPGQWALLAEESEGIEDGDYAAVLDNQGKRYLRRVWNAGEDWVLVTTNPATALPAVVVRKCLCKARKLIGVLYAPRQTPQPGGRPTGEWMPRTDFATDLFKGRHAILIEGTSLEPLAQDGQAVIVGEKLSGRASVQPGTLAAVETNGDLGHVLKRVYPSAGVWTLLSPNPIDPRTPLSVAEENILGVWPVEGVLFSLEVVEQ